MTERLRIRRATLADLERIMAIFATARAFMAAHGNPKQWGRTGWPHEDVIRDDIARGESYVVVDDDDRAIATFFFTSGPDAEPTYREIREGSWLSDSPYGVVHRIASDGTHHGIGELCLGWACDRCAHLRIDTHPDNVVMQGLLAQLGFERRGTISVEEDDDPRWAYERLAGNAR